MRKIINDKMYDTETAEKIATHSVEVLYKKKTGEYFLARKGGRVDITPFTLKQAKEWLSEHDFVDEYIMEFGKPEE